VTPAVGLAGAAGHGAKHLGHLVELAEQGRIRFVGVADPQPVPTPVPRFDNHRDLLAATSPDVLVICTPPHTHLPIARDAAEAGCDLLLEKPPMVSLAEHAELTKVLDATGRVCQVGFQALGSAALSRLLAAIAAGALGRVAAVSAVGAWWRPDSYFSRTPWAGRRMLDGRPTLDGAVVNPFAHALMQALVIAGDAPVTQLTVERYRTLDIEVDDTACLRLALAGAAPVTMAVSLRSAEFIAGEILVTGTEGSAVLEYPTDRLQLPGDPSPSVLPGRVDLLADLLDHRAGGTPLRAPLAATARFTAVAQALRDAPDPVLIGPSHLVARPDGAAVDGIARLVRRTGTTRSLFHELAVPWARPPWQTVLPPA
jgi:predicted dehydrogenase